MYTIFMIIIILALLPIAIVIAWFLLPIVLWLVTLCLLGSFVLLLEGQYGYTPEAIILIGSITAISTVLSIVISHYIYE